MHCIQAAIRRHLERRCRFASRTPAPPPFSGINSTPAFWSAPTRASPVSARPPMSPSAASSLLTVGADRRSFACLSPRCGQKLPDVKHTMRPAMTAENKLKSTKERKRRPAPPEEYGRSPCALDAGSRGKMQQLKPTAEGLRDLMLAPTPRANPPSSPLMSSAGH